MSIDFEHSINEVYGNTAEIILAAAKKAIPRGKALRYPPFCNDKIEEVVKASQRNRRTGAFFKYPMPQNRTVFNKLNERPKLIIRDEKRRHWAEKCESLDLVRDSHKAWRLMDNLRAIDHAKNQQPLQ